MITIDKLLVYLGDELEINEQFTVKQPKILDIARSGEKRYFNTIYTLCSIPSDYKSELWDLGINYCDISEFDCFITLSREIHKEDTKLIFSDKVDLSQMKVISHPETGETLLVDPKNKIIINEENYKDIVGFLRSMHGITPKRERAANRETLVELIKEDKLKKLKRSKEPEEGSFLLPLISSMVNSPGFKYNIEELKNLTICQFMDSVQRIPSIATAAAISNGMYSGMVDLSKNPELIKQLNWLRDLSKDTIKHSNVTVSQK